MLSDFSDSRSGKYCNYDWCCDFDSDINLQTCAVKYFTFLIYLFVHIFATVWCVFYVFLCCSVCLFLCGPFFHGALLLFKSTWFTSFLLWTSLQFIFLWNKRFRKSSVFYVLSGRRCVLESKRFKGSLCTIILSNINCKPLLTPRGLTKCYCDRDLVN